MQGRYPKFKHEDRADVAQHRRTRDQFTYGRWRTALDSSDAADQELRAAVRGNLFKSDPPAFEALAARAQDMRALADEKLLEVIDASDAQIANAENWKTLGTRRASSLSVPGRSGKNSTSKIVHFRPMTKPASQEELDVLQERLTWRDDDLVFRRHGRDMDRVWMRGVDSALIERALAANDGVVLRRFESRDQVLFTPTPRGQN